MSERVHFSPIHLDSVEQHRGYESQRADDKPFGFWFSVQKPEPEWTGWLEWCRSEGYGDIDNAKAHRLDVDDSRILSVGPDDIDWFNETFGINNPIALSRFTDRRIRWDLVAEQFSGIEISPYSWAHRLQQSVGWYYTWDCASGCIWDVSAIKSIKRIPIGHVPSRCDAMEVSAA